MENSQLYQKIIIVKKQNYLIISAYADDIEEFADSVQSMIAQGGRLMVNKFFHKHAISSLRKENRNYIIIDRAGELAHNFVLI